MPVEILLVRALGGLSALADPHSEPPDFIQEPHLGCCLNLYWVKVWRYYRLLRVYSGSLFRLPVYFVTYRDN